MKENVNLLVEQFRNRPADCAEAVWDMDTEQRCEVVLRNLYLIDAENVVRTPADDLADIAEQTDTTALALAAYESLLIYGIKEGEFDLISENVKAAHIASNEQTAALLFAFIILASKSAS
jgi:hypothetical protein